MEIYNYHPIYKYYLNSSNADESPLNPGEFLVPAHATLLKPPTCNEDEIQVFNGISWEIIKNYSGIYYSTDDLQKIINENPFEPPENATKEKPLGYKEGYLLKWDDGWKYFERPKPPELTPEEKLEQSGLTVEELKELLGL
jgi:hypothetical protein